MRANLDKHDIWVLILGFLTPAKIRIIGIFSGAEILLIFMCLFQKNNQYKENKYVTKLVLFAILWMIGTIISNIHNHVDQLDFSKGVFFLIILIIIIPPIYGLMREKPERIVLYILGYGLGSLFLPYITNDIDIANAMKTDVFLYYRIRAFIAGLSYFLYFIGKDRFALFLFYSISVIGLFCSARNPFLTGTIAILLLFFIRKNYKGLSEEASNLFKRDIPKYFIITIIVIVSVDFVYERLASSGILGLSAKEKYDVQVQGGNVLVGGRTETFLGIDSILENPIWGYGSYAKDINNVFHMRYAKKYNMENMYNLGGQDRFMPSHSHIVGAWVQNGILGGIFWMYILFMLWKVFRSGCFLFEPRILCLVICKICTLLWDIFFSGFGDRVSTMFFFITLLVIYDSAEKGLYKNGEVKRLNI